MESSSVKSAYRRFAPRNTRPRQKDVYNLNAILMQDPAWLLYVSTIASRRRNHGVVSRHSISTAINGARKFLQFLNKPITATALSELVQETRDRHRQDDFTIDESLLRYVATPPLMTHANHGAFLKGFFKANRAALQASFNTCFTHSTRKISPGILKALYDSLPDEHRLLMDYQAYAGERLAALCVNITTRQIEIVGEKYATVHVQPLQTKARKEHICIIPRPLAERILHAAQLTGRTDSAPFPNCWTIWREITEIALNKFGIRLTSHYLRKRFHTIAGKTAMPVNSWDFLMGAQQSLGHNAGTYTLEDFTDLMAEYDRYLAPYLSISDPREPNDPRDPLGSNETALEGLRKENADLKAQLIENNRIMQKLLAKLG